MNNPSKLQAVDETESFRSLGGGFMSKLSRRASSQALGARYQTQNKFVVNPQLALRRETGSTENWRGRQISRIEADIKLRTILIC